MNCSTKTSTLKSLSYLCSHFYFGFCFRAKPFRSSIFDTESVFPHSILILTIEKSFGLSENDDQFGVYFNFICC